MNNGFYIQDIEESSLLLEDLFIAVTSEEGTLAGGEKLGIAGEAIQGLRETELSFGHPTNELIQLTEDLFLDLGLELSPIHRQQMKESFDFYYFTLNTSIKPEKGARFSSLECALDFELEEDSGQVIIQSIFPTSAWAEILSLGGRISLALDGGLEWGIGIEAPEFLQQILSLSGLSNHLKTRVENSNSLKAFITTSNFAFTVGKAKITATGNGTSNCFWRIQKPDISQTQTIQFGVVFKVPKNTKLITVQGLVIAEPSWAWLANSLRNVFEALSDKLKSLFLKGNEERQGAERLPIGDHERWTLVLPNRG